MSLTRKIVFIVGIFHLMPWINGAKILLTVPISGKSHWVYAENFVEALLQRGHEVTCITNYAFRGKAIYENYTEVKIEHPYDYTTMVNLPSVLTPLFQTSVSISITMPLFARKSADHAFNDTNVQKLIHDKTAHFDLLINHEIFLDSFAMLAYRFKAPLVTICPFGVPDSFDNDMGLLTPYSHVPSVFLPYSDNMTFLQRWANTLFSMLNWIMRELVHNPLQNGLAEKYFGHLGELPTVQAVLRNRSLMFTNLHRAFSYPRPSMGLVYIGGAHIKEAKPLPDDLQVFIDGAEHGVIYFSFGTVIDGLFFNDVNKVSVFLAALGKLKQRVIWKCSSDSLKLPPNVMVRKWLPQVDILAHPNVRLLISHGGLFSNIEAMKFGVPMLVIPFFGDQMRNAQRIVQAGYGISMNLNDVDQTSLAETINKLLYDQSYRDKAQEISQILNDNIVHPMDEFIWWVEYVIRTKGAKHMKSHASEMSWYSYLLVDVFVANILLVIAIVFILRAIISRLCCRKKVHVMEKQD